MVDAIAELNDHVGALRVRRGLEAAGLKLLGDDPGIALELEPAVLRHAAGGHDEEGLALRRGHRLIAGNGGVDLLGAGGQADSGGAERKRGNEIDGYA